MVSQYRWLDYEARVAEEGSRWVKKFPPEKNPEMAKAIEDQIFGVDGPITVQRHPGRDEQYFWLVLNGFAEVHACTERMQDIAVYVGSFPYRSTDLDRIRCLRYHVENYFHEAYMLRERLKAYLTRLERAFRGDRRHSSIAAATQLLIASCADALRGISDTRSGHVHKVRFDTKELSKLELLRLLSGSGDLPKALNEYYEVEYRRIRLEWKDLLQRNNREIEKLLDHVAAHLLPALFDAKRKRFKYPRATVT